MARAAAQLALRARHDLPPLVLMTDDARLVDPVAAAQALPPGSLVILRAREAKKRAQLLAQMLSVSRARGLVVLVADDPVLAARADGLHLPELRAHQAAHWRARRPGWIITLAWHRAGRMALVPGAVDAILLSPILPTQSHAGAPALGLYPAMVAARASLAPVYALGGMDARAGRRLAGTGFCGLAAIGALRA